jgi:hypothetical protein
MTDEMPDRDPTPGELRIMFSNILDSLRDVKETMATKEFVNAKFDGYNDRVARLEVDVKDLSASSSAAHVKLDAESQARAANMHTEIDAKILIVNNRIDALEAEQKAQEGIIKANRNSRVTGITIAVVGSVLSLIVGIIVNVVIRGLFPS